MRGFRFGVLGWVGTEMRACGSHRALWDEATMDIAAWTVRLIQPNNDLRLRCGDHAASSTRLSHREQDEMPHAIIRGKNGRRHEVDFGDAPIRVEIYASDETVEIFVEADFETHAEERRRFAILNIPRNLFSEASGAAARRSSTSSLKNRMDR